VEWIEGREGIPWLGKGEERGGRSEEALCEIGSGSGLGFGTGDLVLFGARVWDWPMKLGHWMEASWTVEMCFGGVIRGYLGSIFLLAEKIFKD
jgi:hypothetical protein